MGKAQLEMKRGKYHGGSMVARFSFWKIPFNMFLLCNFDIFTYDLLMLCNINLFLLCNFDV